MSLYIVRTGTPTVMVASANRGERYASFLLDHPMIFEDRELVEFSPVDEYVFKRMNKTFYFSKTTVIVVE